MKKVIMVTALIALFATSAIAAPTPKNKSIVTKDIITVGDVFKDAGEDADFYLAPAPEIGEKTILNTKDLMRISNALNLGWVATNNYTRTIISRSSDVITSDDIKSALQKEFEKKLGSRKFEVELSNRKIKIQVPEKANSKVDVHNLKYNAAKQTFSASISVSSIKNHKKEIRGKLHHIMAVPVLINPLRRGDIISRDDIDYIDMRTSDITSNTLINKNKLIGQTPRRGIAAMRPITRSDIKPPMLIKKGDLVVMNLNTDGLKLITQGRAIQNGVEGDVIKIENSDSGHIITAIVTGRRTVSVNPPLAAAIIN